jgi:hypothetical protein
MKLVTAFHNGNEITVRNNIWGYESVYYNGTRMSKKFSLLGATHRFQVQEENVNTLYEIKVGFNTMGVVGVNIYRNGLPLILTLNDNSLEATLV